MLESSKVMQSVASALELLAADRVDPAFGALLGQLTRELSYSRELTVQLVNAGGLAALLELLRLSFKEQVRLASANRPIALTVQLCRRTDSSDESRHTPSQLVNHKSRGGSVAAAAEAAAVIAAYGRICGFRGRRCSS